MAKKNTGEQPLPKLDKSKSKTGFVGNWVSEMRSFETADVGRGVDSYWNILPGHKIQEPSGRVVTCKVKGNTIRIPYGTELQSYWHGELREDGKLIISTSNGMMRYLCERVN